MLDGKAAVETAAVVTVAAGPADKTESDIRTDKSGYTAGETMTVTLADAQKNPVTGQATALKEAVKVQRAEDEQHATWTESGSEKDTYTSVYTAKEVGTHNAMLTMEDWVKPSDSYSIRQADEIIGLTTPDGHTFKPDEGFPTTGYRRASFTIELSNGNPDDFSWTAQPNWVTVSDDGVVSLGDDGGRGEVKITGTPKYPGIDEVEYTFKINQWFKQMPTPSGTFTSISPEQRKYVMRRGWILEVTMRRWSRVNAKLVFWARNGDQPYTPTWSSDSTLCSAGPPILMSIWD